MFGLGTHYPSLNVIFRGKIKKSSILVREDTLLLFEKAGEIAWL